MGDLNLTAADLRVLTYHGLWVVTRLRTLQSKLAAKKAEIEQDEQSVRMYQRELNGVNTELQARKYHDIGHAREQFETKTVDGKRVTLAPEELDSVVRMYLERRKELESIP